MGPVWALVVAAGSGRRFGGRKQFVELAGRPLVEWAVEACRVVADSVVLVLPTATGSPTYGADVVVAGGSTRSASVRCGLAAVPPDAAAVVIHDGARPLAAPSLFTAVVAAVAEGAGASVCALPLGDTVKSVSGDVATGRATVTGTRDRDALVTVQTPQAFAADVLRRAHARGGEATDDAALVELLGETVRAVPGDPWNLKVTTHDDLAAAEVLWAANPARPAAIRRSGAPRQQDARPLGGAPS